MEREDMIAIVTARYPDAYARKYAALSMVIWCPLLDCRLSGFFHTENEAWEDAVEWVKKKEIKKKGFIINRAEDLKNYIFLKNGGLMHIDEWMNIPAEGTSRTEDAEFEIIEPKQLPTSSPST